MKVRLHYGTTAKALHWLIVALLATQYLIGWFMPNIKANMAPGVGMTWHVSIGTTILAIMVLRFAWRLSHPVAPESSLLPYQRITSEAVHWLLYVLVLLTTLSGWLIACDPGKNLYWLEPAPELAKPRPGNHDRCPHARARGARRFQRRLRLKRNADRPARAGATAAGRRRHFFLADCCWQILVRGDDGGRAVR